MDSIESRFTDADNPRVIKIQLVLEDGRMFSIHATSLDMTINRSVVMPIKDVDYVPIPFQPAEFNYTISATLRGGPIEHE